MVSRFAVVEAPGELAVVQSLLNTAAVPKNGAALPDLLDTPDTAAAWLASVGAPTDQPGLRELHRLRDALRAALISRDHEPSVENSMDGEISMSVTVRLGSDGTVSVGPQPGEGLAERILLTVYAAQLTKDWSRLKVCRNPQCRVAFWDSSRNSSAVWHDSRTCGNIANLRNSRARRRTVTAGKPAPDPNPATEGRNRATLPRRSGS
ncbi:CGNR zinc finger domain-containing protein [Kribbella sp. NPDC049584]|uniref:CGNR zinc finger domain-containing protein n=1 Tax=Kribbella sp. NPDC049584 TaxID=3154833 RepID=UPI00343C6F1E